ncbi:hypothetical protein B0H14DRAFT_3457881 [Mycena olivaceomarginata]|nr:hypothetical protein B0H14DRAFT_3457881 [Mycena olivaceomarginata]
MDSPPPIGPISVRRLALLVFVSFTVARPTLKLCLSSPISLPRTKLPHKTAEQSRRVVIVIYPVITGCLFCTGNPSSMRGLERTLRNVILDGLKPLQVCLNAVKVELDGERSGNINTLGESCDEAHSRPFLDYFPQIFTGAAVDPDATGKIGQFNVYCAAAPGTSWQMPYCLRPDCHVDIGPHAARRSGPLPHLLPKGDANRDAALDIARNLGQIARDNWQNAHPGESVHWDVSSSSKAKASAARNGKNVIKATDAACRGRASRMSQVKANPTAAAEAEEPVHIPYDEYCAITYATAGLQPRLIKLIGFIQPNTPPTIDYAWLRFLGRFEVSKFPFAVIDGEWLGPDPVVFECWCIFSRTWKLENLEPINMTERVIVIRESLWNTNLLRNKPSVPAPKYLGPFDGRVGAIFQANGETYYITTKCDYIPVPPLSTQVYVHSDMRYGVDDPTLWPQPFSNKYFHLAAMPKRESRPDLDFLWWEPTRNDFVFGQATTRGLGRLRFGDLQSFIDYAEKLRERYRAFIASKKDAVPDYFGELVQTIILTIERLHDLPTTYERMKFALASLQTKCLELKALLDFTTIYQPILKNPDAPDSTRVAPCMGTFTTIPEVAQKLDRAGLPFWLLRPYHTFDRDIILEVVDILQPPPALTEECPPDHQVVYSGSNIDEKIAAMFKASRTVGWYRDPFDLHPPPSQPPAAGPNYAPSSQSTPSVEDTVHSRSPDASPISGGVHPSSYDRPATNTEKGRGQARQLGHTARGQADGRGRGHRTPLHSCYSPYDRRQVSGRGRGKGRSGHGQSQTSRDKFKRFVAEEMPPYIEVWADALEIVDQSSTLSVTQQDKHYVYPEPALLAAPGGSLLSSQEWRDIFDGRIDRDEAHRNQRTARSRRLEDIVGPSLRAVGIDDLHDFPPPKDSIPSYDTHQFKQIIWDIAEVNFRFEFLALDRRATGRHQAIPHQDGLASPDIVERHRYYTRYGQRDVLLACPNAMPDCNCSHGGTQRRGETVERGGNAGSGVGGGAYYTQSFFELFGRAAVLPMRLEHDFVDIPAVKNITENNIADRTQPA